MGLFLDTLSTHFQQSYEHGCLLRESTHATNDVGYLNITIRNDTGDIQEELIVISADVAQSCTAVLSSCANCNHHECVRIGVSVRGHLLSGAVRGVGFDFTADKLAAAVIAGPNVGHDVTGSSGNGEGRQPFLL